MAGLRIVLAAAMLCLLATAPAQAAMADKDGDQRLAAGLLGAMRLAADGKHRAADAGAAIGAYKSAGIVAARPNGRYDYTDYYVLKKPARLLGHELLMIDQEYMRQYVGCCVSPGIGVLVRAGADQDELEQFADKNGCRLSVGKDAWDWLPGSALGKRLKKNDVAYLSCRERDIGQ